MPAPQQQDRQILDWASVTPVEKPKDPVGKFTGDNPESAAPPPKPQPQQPQPPQQQQQEPAPAPTPTPAPTPEPQRDKIQDRINKLYGRWKGAEEEASRLRQRVDELERMITQQTRAPAQSWGAQPATPQPPADPYSYGAPEPSPYVSRAELLEALKQQQDALLSVLNQREVLSQQQAASWADAERDLPELRNPELRGLAQDILRRDPALSNDPNGPYKAALIARGAAISPAQPPATEAAKVAASGIGQIAQGGPEPTDAQNDLRQQYEQALARFRETGKFEDGVLANTLRNRLLGR